MESPHTAINGGGRKQLGIASSPRPAARYWKDSHSHLCCWCEGTHRSLHVHICSFSSQQHLRQVLATPLCSRVQRRPFSILQPTSAKQEGKSPHQHHTHVHATKGMASDRTVIFPVGAQRHHSHSGSGHAHPRHWPAAPPPPPFGLPVQRSAKVCAHPAAREG